MTEKLFNVGTKGIVVNDDKVLILKKNHDQPFWELPGGRISGDETIEQTLRRELQEEVPNIRITSINKVTHAYRVPKDIHDGVGLVLIFYAVEADFDSKPEISEEHSECRWVTTEEAVELLGESYRQAIEAAEKHEMQSGM